ncbi:hypothetical protein [Nocardia violaceofusca]|uniref:hypothetical protein n=1 Tax=Nocardia violaceofusca TaxID=941182 RepID=UPI0007A3E0DC|nr:hypothetical protein [Nocardia violaceofusca]
MKPLLYGYLRLDVAGERIGECEGRIRSFADREGYDLGMVFHERRWGRAALDALIAELRRAECRDVVVPTVDHLTAPDAVRQAVESRLWCEAGAGVLIAAAASGTGQLDGAGR